MDKVVPCKTCGNKPKIKDVLFVLFIVECEYCQKAIPPIGATSKETAIKEWNKENE